MTERKERRVQLRQNVISKYFKKMCEQLSQNKISKHSEIRMNLHYIQLLGTWPGNYVRPIYKSMHR